MKYPGNIKPLHGGISAAPFIGVLFLMVPMLLFHTSIVFKPGIEVDLSLPISKQKTGVTDPSLSIAVDAKGVIYFHNRQVLGQIFSETVKEEDEGTPLVDLVINRVEELDSNLLIRLVDQGRVLLNGKPAEAETQLKSGHQIELDVPATELLRRRVEQEIERGSLAILRSKAISYGLSVQGDYYEIEQRVAAYERTLPDQVYFDTYNEILSQLIDDPEIVEAIKARRLSPQRLALYRKQFGELIKVKNESFRDKISLLIQAGKDVRHETIVDLCAMAGEVGVGRVLLATRPMDFTRPPDPEK